MSFITVSNLGIGFRGPSLFDDVSCRVGPSERIGLLGRNGAGKTTLMRMIAGDVEPDAGEIVLAPGVAVDLLPQDVPADIEGTVAEVVASRLQKLRKNAPEWEIEQATNQMLSRMQLDGDARFETLSSGMKRRVILARTLAPQPDVLLLDEPTNHLDIEAIEWLEQFLLKWSGTLMFVTHDRMFLRKLATRILEIDRGQMFDWACDYDTFLKRKEEALAAQEKQDALFDKKLAIEEAWIRQGIKARRTRNEGRVKALKKMREQRSDRRKVTGKVNLQIEEAQRSGALVARVDDISFRYDERTIFEDFSTIITRGDKIGLIGPNGIGKTTLLKVILGELSPTEGNVKLGSNLSIAYFDQLREQLDEERTVQENVGEGGESISLAGGKKHVLGYLQDFLFAPERARTQVKFLSGGERNRVLLAKLFSKPANVIVLDEPTNDLDSETLELLEERLVDFDGTVLVVSHDREFLNNVVTSTIVYENGGLKEYDGGYDDWLRQRPEPIAPEAEKPGRQTRKPLPPPVDKPRKRSYKERQEYEQLPEKIDAVEMEIRDMHSAMASPDFYQQAGDKIAAASDNLKTAEEQLANLYARFEELDELGE